MKTLSLLLPILLPGVMPAQSPVASVNAPEVVNVGRGEVKVRPDRASLTVAVVTHGSSAAAAGALNAQRVAPLLRALARQGIADSLISATGYNVGTQYEDPSHPLPAARRYVARNAVAVTVTRLDDLGKIIDTALAAGATEINEVRFASSEAKSARQRAIALAIESARADATAAAAAAGGTLGSIIEITVDPSGMYDGGLAMREIMPSNSLGGVSTDVSLPRELTILVQVRVRSALVR